MDEPDTPAPTPPPPESSGAGGFGGIVAALVLFLAAGLAATALPFLLGGKDPGEGAAVDVIGGSGLEVRESKVAGPDGKPVTRLVLAPTPDALPMMGDVPEFSFEDAAGGRLGRADLLGKVWAVDFIFTRCAGICPDMTRTMAVLQAEVEGRPDARLVSISTDPDRDTAEVLREYGTRYAAKDGFWHFLRGPVEDVLSLSYEGFHIGDRENRFAHSERIVLVDREGRIRGYYRGTDEDASVRLVRDFRALLGPAPTPATPDR